jgi:hypothetical protein
MPTLAAAEEATDKALETTLEATLSAGVTLAAAADAEEVTEPAADVA